MEYGAIDLHKKESQVRIVTEDGEITDRRIATTRDRLTALFWGRPPPADSDRVVDRQRMGGATPRDAGPRGDRGRSELHRHVWPSQSPRQNRPARCRRVGGRRPG